MVNFNTIPCARIYYILWLQNEAKISLKNIIILSKNFKKSIDILKSVCYDIKAVSFDSSVFLRIYEV